MVSKKSQSTIWKAESRLYGFEWEGGLVARWEVDNDSISDDYTPQEISAEELFGLRVNKVKGKRYPNELIPIYWQVVPTAIVPGRNVKPESMPFQFQSYKLGQDSLTHYTWPVSKETGEPLNWLTLPVMDKLWNDKRSDKGGFIQEFTGWKPGILQPYVYLPSLLQSGKPA